MSKSKVQSKPKVQNATPLGTTTGPHRAGRRGKRGDAHYQALAILGRRDHAEQEMRRKLRQKGFSDTTVVETIAWLFDQHLLNDEAFARAYVGQILAVKPVGRRWLEAKLRARGIARALIDHVVASAVPAERERMLLHEAASQWRAQHPAHLADRARLQRFLLSRGFSPEAVFGELGQ